MLDYVGYLILFQLPIVGFIMIIFYSIKAKNKNLKNFARAILLLGVIVVVLYIIVLLLLGDSLGNLSSGSSLTSVLIPLGCEFRSFVRERSVGMNPTDTNRPAGRRNHPTLAGILWRDAGKRGCSGDGALMMKMLEN